MLNKIEIFVGVLEEMQALSFNALERPSTSFSFDSLLLGIPN